MKTIILVITTFIIVVFPKLSYSVPASINGNVSVSAYVPVPLPPNISQVYTNYSMDNFVNGGKYKIVIEQDSPYMAQNLGVSVNYIAISSNVEFTYTSGPFTISYYINTFAGQGQTQSMRFRIYRKVLGVWDWQTTFFYDLNSTCTTNAILPQGTYPLYQGDYEVANSLTVTSNVYPSGGVAEFDGGASVSLLPGFKTDLSGGGSVLAIIDGCGGAYRIIEGKNNILENEPISNTDYFKVYPNPTQGEFTIEISNSEIGDEIKLQIRDINGKILHSENKLYENYIKADLNSFEPGLYFINISGKNIQYNQKIIKQ